MDLMLEIIHIIFTNAGAGRIAGRPYLYTDREMEDLPGGDLVEAGLRDLAAGVESIPALLVSIGAPRLRRLGFAVPSALPSPELRLYEQLSRADPDAAHSRYNALVRRLVSFERAAACVS